MNNTPAQQHQNPEPVADDGRHFARWLDAMRVERDLSWAEVARRAGVSETGLRKIRQGDATPRPATIEALSSAVSDDYPEPVGVFGDFIAHPPIGAQRADVSTTWLTVGVTGGRAKAMDADTAGRLIVFLQHAARAWLATTDCPEGD